MADQVITLKVGNSSIPFYREDWPAIKNAVEKAMRGRVMYSQTDGSARESVTATRYIVAEKSKLATPP